MIAATSERGSSRSQVKTPRCIASLTRSSLMRDCRVSVFISSSSAIDGAVWAEDRQGRGAGHRRSDRLSLRGTTVRLPALLAPVLLRSADADASVDGNGAIRKA